MGRDLLKDLNDPQRSAVTHGEGPLVVFAGAGSGKTRIITTRIAYLIENGVKPHQILAVTFTNKAAGEMRQRVEALSRRADGCLVTTFHSACARWLREFAGELGFTSDFTIYDDGDSVAALKTILKEMQVEDFAAQVQDYKHFIGKAKTMALMPKDFEKFPDRFAQIMPSGGLAVYFRYQEYLAACNAMDFGDLIMNMLFLLRRNQAVRDLLQSRFRYILVDEYQDTNRTQFELITILAQKFQNLCVVGDDDQSIYSWRGATPSNILDFDIQYPGATKVTLDQNYRCSGTVVKAAKHMIAHNVKRQPKELWTANEDGEQVGYRLEADGQTEARWVVEQIQGETRRYPLTDVAIFYRTNAQSRLLEEALRVEDVPYKIYGSVRFYDRLEVKDVLAYFKLIVNERDDISFRRIVNVPSRKIGARTVEVLAKEAEKRELSLMATLKAWAAEPDSTVNPKLCSFLELMNGLSREVLSYQVGECLELLLKKTRYAEHLEKKFPADHLDKLDNVHELGVAMQEFERREPLATMAEWLQSVSLSSEDSEDVPGVSMMSLHMAKGLEFRRVYIVGVEDGLIPHSSNQEDPEKLEEERRLLYVGMTRAMEKLSLCGVYRRRNYDRWLTNRPSRFLSEIPLECLDTESDILSPAVENSGSSGFLEDGMRYDYEESQHLEEIVVGAQVEHPTYGRGVIQEFQQEFGIVKAVVRFADVGLRKVPGHHLRAPS